MVLFLSNAVLTRDVYAHLDLRALLLIGGMLALGKAFQASGLDHELTVRLQQLGGAFGSPRVLVAALLFATALLTQVTTHIAAATIMTPIALSFAGELGIDERAFVMAVVTGASLAFMSPVAHQANAMVVGPGDYRYRDFLRVGTPLSLLLFAAAWLLIPLMFGLEPAR
jgi:di/tricarboxylate transporter